MKTFTTTTLLLASAAFAAGAAVPQNAARDVSASGFKWPCYEVCFPDPFGCTEICWKSSSSDSVAEKRGLSDEKHCRTNCFPSMSGPICHTTCVDDDVAVAESAVQKRDTLKADDVSVQLTDDSGNCYTVCIPYFGGSWCTVTCPK